MLFHFVVIVFMVKDTSRLVKAEFKNGHLVHSSHEGNRDI